MKRYATYLAIILCVWMVIMANFTRGDDFRYDSKGRRDPFVPLIGPDRVAVAGIEDVTSIADVNLEGIAAGARGTKVAIINGEMLREGERIGNLEMKKIRGTSVTLIIGGMEHNLNLSEEGGSKGER